MRIYQGSFRAALPGSRSARRGFWGLLKTKKLRWTVGGPVLNPEIYPPKDLAFLSWRLTHTRDNRRLKTPIVEPPGQSPTFLGSILSTDRS